MEQPQEIYFQLFLIELLLDKVKRNADDIKLILQNHNKGTGASCRESRDV